MQEPPCVGAKELEMPPFASVTRILAGCALTTIVTTTSPPARAADYGSAPETVIVDRQAQAPATQNNPAPQQRPESSPPESNVGEIAKTAVITTLISIAVGLTVCVVSAGTVCVFPF
jgi:hypothetical protein